MPSSVVLAKPPAVETRERKPVLDALRPRIEADLKQKVVFLVRTLRVRDGWAYVEVEPQAPTGKPVSYRDTPYAAEIGSGKGLLFALLRKQSTWKVVHWRLGAADTVLTEPIDQFGKPPYNAPHYVLSGENVPAPYTPTGKERKAILDTLRIPVQKDLNNRPVVFKVDTLRVRDGWAFLGGVPLGPNGKPFDYRGTQYEERIKEGVFGGDIYALLRQEKGRWRVITFVLGPTDVTWVDWDTRYGAPHRLFPELQDKP